MLHCVHPTMKRPHVQRSPVLASCTASCTAPYQLLPLQMFLPRCLLVQYAILPCVMLASSCGCPCEIGLGRVKEGGKGVRGLLGGGERSCNKNVSQPMRTASGNKCQTSCVSNCTSPSLVAVYFTLSFFCFVLVRCSMIQNCPADCTSGHNLERMLLYRRQAQANHSQNTGLGCAAGHKKNPRAIMQNEHMKS